MIELCLAMIDIPSDKEKFTDIYNTYKSLIFRTVMKVLNNESLADEAVQDCLLKIASVITKFGNVQSKKTRALIIIIARNKAHDKIRSEHMDKTEPADEKVLLSQASLRDIFTDVGYRELVREITSLDEIYCDILTLKLIYEYSLEEICAMLGISENTAKSRIYRGRKILKERLEGFSND